MVMRSKGIAGILSVAFCLVSETARKTNANINWSSNFTGKHCHSLIALPSSRPAYRSQVALLSITQIF
jgi:hypothetical protein